MCVCSCRATLFLEKKSADLPYIQSGLLQPLIRYGEACALRHILQCELVFARLIPYEVAVRLDN